MTTHLPIPVRDEEGETVYIIGRQTKFEVVTHFCLSFGL